MSDPISLSDHRAEKKRSHLRLAHKVASEIDGASPGEVEKIWIDIAAQARHLRLKLQGVAQACDDPGRAIRILHNELIELKRELGVE